MPKEYEKIRDSLVSRGKDYDEAQRIAAATYNKRHKGNPISSIDRHRSKKRRDDRSGARRK